MRGAVCVLSVSLASIAVAAGVAAGQGKPLIVAYMTSDGELVPVSRFDGKQWTNSWPEPIPQDTPLPVRSIRDIPDSWLAQPVPSTWITWSEMPAKYTTVRVTGVDRDGSCVQAITLTTSLKPDPPSEGLAFNKPTTVDAVATLGSGSADGVPLARHLAPHFKTALTKMPRSSAANETEIGTKVLALARLDARFEEGVVVTGGYGDPRERVFFIEAQRQFDGNPSDTDYDALSYGGWFRKNTAGALVPIAALLAPMSTAQGKLPRYTAIGILRTGRASIWAMAEWGIESQTIVLFEVSAKAVRKLTSADVSGC